MTLAKANTLNLENLGTDGTGFVVLFLFERDR